MNIHYETPLNDTNSLVNLFAPSQEIKSVSLTGIADAEQLIDALSVIAYESAVNDENPSLHTMLHDRCPRARRQAAEAIRAGLRYTLSRDPEPGEFSFLPKVAAPDYVSLDPSGDLDTPLESFPSRVINLAGAKIEFLNSAAKKHANNKLL